MTRLYRVRRRNMAKLEMKTERKEDMSTYESKLNNICDKIKSMSGTAGARALRAIVMDLEGDGPIGEMLHSLDAKNFEMAIVLQEFKRTGRYEHFNTIHAQARERLGSKS